MRLNKNTLTTLGITALLISLLFIPWQNRIEAPALLTVKERTELFLPLPGRLETIQVKEGQEVKKGQSLLEFASSDLNAQLKQQKIKVEGLSSQISLHGQTSELIANRQILLSELANAESEYQALLDEKKKLRITAPFAGKVLKLNESLQQGLWVAKDETLLMLAKVGEWQLEAYVVEEFLGQIKNSHEARFYPGNIEHEAIDATIIRIDKAAASSLKAEFASRYTGSIAVKENPQELIPQNSVYRVLLKADSKAYQQTQRGNVMIMGEAESLANLLWKRILSVLVREWGF